MSGHSKWHSIKHQKGIADATKAISLDKDLGYAYIARAYANLLLKKYQNSVQNKAFS